MPLELLKQIPLFSGLTQKELSELSESAERRRYPKGNIVIYKGEEGQALFLIMKGGVKVVLDNEKGKEIILGLLDTGNYFGEMSLFDQRPRSANIVTTEDSEFLVISSKALQGKIRENPDLALKLLTEMSRRLRNTNEQISSLALFDVRGRVARILLQLCMDQHYKKEEACYLAPRPALKDVADMVGTSRETVSRILSEFSKQGLISLKKKSIVVYDSFSLNNFLY